MIEQIAVTLMGDNDPDVRIPAITALLVAAGGDEKDANRVARRIARKSYDNLRDAAMRAAYAVRAVNSNHTRRQESRYFSMHVQAEKARDRARKTLTRMVKLHGEIIGWAAVMDEATTPECRDYHGNNFLASRPPREGLPGTLHGGTCRCQMVPPWPNGRLIT